MTNKPIFYGCYETEAEQIRREFRQAIAAYLCGTAVTLLLVVAAMKFL